MGVQGVPFILRHHCFLHRRGHPPLKNPGRGQPYTEFLRYSRVEILTPAKEPPQVKAQGTKGQAGQTRCGSNDTPLRGFE